MVMMMMMMGDSGTGSEAGDAAGGGGGGAKVIIHADLDAFYAQVEHHRHPELDGRPLAVQQWRGLIAIDYACKAAGVTRFMNMQEAKRVCPDIQFVHVDIVHGKASLEPYRRASRDIMDVFEDFGVCERASIDEAYLDVTKEAMRRRKNSPVSFHTLQKAKHIVPGEFTFDKFARDGATHEDLLQGALASTHVIGFPADLVGRGWQPKTEGDFLLLEGAAIAAEIRVAVYERLGYAVSAGVAHNKMLAKIGSGFNKPGHQTLIPQYAARPMLAKLPLKKVPQLHGKMGSKVKLALQESRGAHWRYQNNSSEEVLVEDCLGLTLEYLSTRLGREAATWVYNFLRGQDTRSVQPKGPPRSLLEAKSTSKAMTTFDALQHWVSNLCFGLSERVLDDQERNKRWPKNLVVQYRKTHTGGEFSRSCGRLPTVSKGEVEHHYQQLLRVAERTSGSVAEGGTMEVPPGATPAPSHEQSVPGGKDQDQLEATAIKGETSPLTQHHQQPQPPHHQQPQPPQQQPQQPLPAASAESTTAQQTHSTHTRASSSGEAAAGAQRESENCYHGFVKDNILPSTGDQQQDVWQRARAAAVAEKACSLVMATLREEFGTQKFSVNRLAVFAIFHVTQTDAELRTGKQRRLDSLFASHVAAQPAPPQQAAAHHETAVNDTLVRHQGVADSSRRKSSGQGKGALDAFLQYDSGKSALSTKEAPHQTHRGSRAAIKATRDEIEDGGHVQCKVQSVEHGGQGQHQRQNTPEHVPESQLDQQQPEAGHAASSQQPRRLQPQSISALLASQTDAHQKHQQKNTASEGAHTDACGADAASGVTQCPVCGSEVPTATATAHVNAHFEAEEGLQAQGNALASSSTSASRGRGTNSKRSSSSNTNKKRAKRGPPARGKAARSISSFFSQGKA